MKYLGALAASSIQATQTLPCRATWRLRAQQPQVTNCISNTIHVLINHCHLIEKPGLFLPSLPNVKMDGSYSCFPRAKRGYLIIWRTIAPIRKLPAAFERVWRKPNKKVVEPRCCRSFNEACIWGEWCFCYLPQKSLLRYIGTKGYTGCSRPIRQTSPGPLKREAKDSSEGWYTSLSKELESHPPTEQRRSVWLLPVLRYQP